MTTINEQEISEIVKRVVGQAMGDGKPASQQTDVASMAKRKIDPSAGISQPSPAVLKTVAIGSDHGGFELKEKLKKHLAEAGFQVTDCGPNDTSSVDYPDYAHAVAKLVASKQVWRGIMIDGAGIGSCMAANKVPGVRAAMCYDYASAVNSREHNDANLLTLGAGLIGQNQAVLIVDTWLKTEFGGGRHARRVDKITDIEKLYSKGGS
jgi:ribose 5-phosphate isomerase B